MKKIKYAIASLITAVLLLANTTHAKACVELHQGELRVVSKNLNVPRSKLHGRWSFAALEIQVFVKGSFIGRDIVEVEVGKVAPLITGTRFEGAVATPPNDSVVSRGSGLHDRQTGLCYMVL